MVFRWNTVILVALISLSVFSADKVITVIESSTNANRTLNAGLTVKQGTITSDLFPSGDTTFYETIIAGSASMRTGKLKLYNATNGNTVTLQAGVTGGNHIYTLPTSLPGVDGYKLVSTTGGAMSWVTPGGAPTGTAGGDLTSTYPNPEVAKASKSFALTGSITPAITASQNNWNPTGLADASVILSVPDADWNLTGLSGGSDGRVIVITNTNIFTLTLVDQSGSSSAANRFNLGGTNLGLTGNQSVVLRHNGTNWCTIANSFRFAGDATLIALAGYNTNGLVAQIAADTFAGRTITGTTSQVNVSNGSGVSGNPTLSLPQDIDTDSDVEFGSLTLVTPLDETYGGTGQTSYSLGNILYSSASNTLSKLAGNTSTSEKFLGMTGTGMVAAAPAWGIPHGNSGGTGRTSYTAGGIPFAPTGVWDGAQLSELAPEAGAVYKYLATKNSGTPSYQQPNITEFAGFGTGVATALAINVGSAGAPVTFNGAGGTPSSLTLTNATGAIVAGGGTGVASTTAYAPLFGGTTSTSALQSGTVGTSRQVLTSNGAGALATFQSLVPNGPAFNGFRLTLATGSPVTTTDQTAKTTIYLTPYESNVISLYDGSANWDHIVSAEVSLALGTITAFQAYDVFAYNNAGTLTLESLEWGNATVTTPVASPGIVTWTGHSLSSGNSFTITGSSLPTGLVANTQYWITVIDANTFKVSSSIVTQAAGTFINFTGSSSGTQTGHSPKVRATALTLQNGVNVKTGATTRLYVGSFMTTATTTTEDSVSRRFVYNQYNSVDRRLFVTDATVSWTYTTATVRPANGSAANKVEVFCGLANRPVHLKCLHSCSNTSSNAGIISAIGINAGNGADPLRTNGIGIAANLIYQLCSYIDSTQTLGYSFYSWDEYSAATGTTTWYSNSIMGVSGFVLQ